MKRYVFPVVLVLIVALCTQGCVCQSTCLFGGKKVRGSGDVVSEEFPVEGITGVNLATIGKLYIELGDEEKLIIEAEDNLMEYFEIDVHRGVLEIETRDNVSLNPREPVNYYLTVKELNKIAVSSIGSIEAPDFKAKRFRVSISSTGNIEMGDLETDVFSVSVSSTGTFEMEDLLAERIDVSISSTGSVYIAGGKVEEQEITISSTGSYNAKRVESNEAEVDISSTGSATIQVSDYLNADLSSTGSVYYVGSPVVDKRRTSLGRVKQVGRGSRRRTI